MINKNSKIFLVGHKGFVGSAILRLLKKKGYKNIFYKTRKDLDLRNQKKTFSYILKIKPDAVILAAGKVGGIKANSNFPAEFIYDNLSIQNNVIQGSFKAKVKDLIFLGSSCIYPKYSNQPIKESYLLSGILEPTNESYAIAKIAGVKLCESYNRQYKTNYKCLMPSNIFGPGDNYNLENSHFFPAIIKKLYNAKKKNISKTIFWGSGSSKRELTFVDEIAEACIFFLKKKTRHCVINIGSGYEKSIKDYINFVSGKINNKSKIVFDKNKKIDGTPRKLLDCSVAKKYGWKSKFKFSTAFDVTYADFLKNHRKHILKI
jgi:GDP-L-fucose synthase